MYLPHVEVNTFVGCLYSDFLVFFIPPSGRTCQASTSTRQTSLVFSSKENDIGSPATNILYRPLEGSVSPCGTIANSIKASGLYLAAHVLLVLQNLDQIPSPRSSPPQEVECWPFPKFDGRGLLGFGAAVLRAPAVHIFWQLASRVTSSRGCWDPAQRIKFYVRINLWAKAHISNS